MSAGSPNTDSRTVAVLGAGSWGTALALVLAANGWSVRLWGHDPDKLAAMARAGHNPDHLPGFPFPATLAVESDLTRLAGWTDRYLVVVPSHAFRETLVQLARARDAAARPPLITWGTKGLEPDSAKLLSEVAREVFDGRARLGVFSGPTFAREVARGLPTALTAAAADTATAEEIADWLRNERIRVYSSEDLVGAQLGGAIKNVMAIAAGISDGLGFGANSRAALITRGLAELRRLGAALGGQPATFMGLAGVGDLILTCTDDQSRNRRFGIGLGRGKAVDAVLAEVGEVVEGYRTARELYRLAHTLDVDMPITEQVYRVCYEAVTPSQAVEALLHREPKKE